MSRVDGKGPTGGDGRRSFRWLDPAETSADAVRNRLLAEASAQIPGLSPDPSLTDPLVRLILSAVAKEYAHVYGKLDGIIDTAFGQLVDSLLSFPRAPQPASTVLRLTLAEPGLMVDDDLVVIGRKAVPEADGVRERNLHFVPYGEQRVPGIAAPLMLRQTPDGAVALRREDGFGTVANVPPGPATWLHLGFEIPPNLELEQLPLFLTGSEAIVRAIRWSPWHLDPAGERAPLVPGYEDTGPSWDGLEEPPSLRSRSDERRPDSPFDRDFVHLDVAPLREIGPEKPAALAAAVAAGALTASAHRYWVSIRCNDQVDPARLVDLEVLTNCVVAFNLRTEPARYKIGLVTDETVDLPVSYDELFRIDSVRDSANVVDFVDAERSDHLAAEAAYHLEHDPGGKARLQLMARAMPARPRVIEVNYVITGGVLANDLAPGSVDTIFNRRLAPGVKDAVSVTSSAGGEAATRRPAVATELRAQLLTRGRAVTRRDFAVLARAYDPLRIREVEVDRGVKRGARGVTACVQVTVKCLEGVFFSDEQQGQFQLGLQRHLEARAPVDQPVLVILA